MNEDKIIDEFINSVNKEFPELEINLFYDEIIDEYVIWHTNSKYTRKNKYFINRLDDILVNKLIDKGVLNFSFGYRDEG